MAGSPLPDMLGVTLFNSRPPGESSRQYALMHDATAHLPSFAPKPLLLSHGRADDMVPVAGTLHLYEVAQPLYAEHPDRLALQLYDHTHTVSEAQMRDAVGWIAPFFIEPGHATEGREDEAEQRAS
jgi:fermentation-respiration switch protein FrsA (DUF1100 family)